MHPISDCGLDPNPLLHHSGSEVLPPMSLWDPWSYQRHHGKELHSTDVAVLIGYPIRLDSTVSGNHLSRVGYPVVLRYAR